MTFLGFMASFFPIAHVAVICFALLAFIQQPNLLTLALLTVAIYLLPPLLFRLYSLRYPIKGGRWKLNRPERCDWWIAHQLQLTYAAIPVFESLLRLIPGCYSAWLRLWGSRVGKRVYWTPLVEILDRHMMRIGDDVVFGHQVICTSHVITKKPTGDIILVVRPTRIGNGTLLGARSRIGPGVRIPEKSIVPYDAEYRLSYARE